MDVAATAGARPHKTFRFRIAAEGVLLVALVWAAFVAYALLRHGTHWPAATKPIPPIPAANFPGRPGISAFENWENFLALGTVVTFLLVKCWAMGRRTVRLDGLGVSLIAANLAFALIYLYTMGQLLFAWQTSAWERRLILRYPLVVVLLIGLIYLCAIPDRPEESAGG